MELLLSCKFFITLTLIVHTAAGLRCYTCTMSADDSDRHCETNPEQVTTSPPIVKCSKKFCYIKRVEYRDPKGVIFSFLRGCDDKLELDDGEYIDDQFITYIRSCTDDLCNLGDGKQPLGNGMDSQASGKIHGTIYTQGIGGSVNNAQLTPVWILLTSLFISLSSIIFITNSIDMTPK